MEASTLGREEKVRIYVSLGFQFGLVLFCTFICSSVIIMVTATCWGCSKHCGYFAAMHMIG